MNKIKVWTYGIAYLSLGVGSGVSIAGNISDTYRLSGLVGRTPDGLDVTVSAFWPAAVLLAIEMFVSTLWPRTTAMQIIRWAGSLTIGFVAMYVSWHHLSDLLSSRGQDSLVSSLGPLAIDGLAVMATGLILSSRVYRTTGQLDNWTGQRTTGQDSGQDNRTSGQGDSVDIWTGQRTDGQDVDMFRDVLAEDDTWTTEDDKQFGHWLSNLSERVDNTTTPAFPLDIMSVGQDTIVGSDMDRTPRTRAQRTVRDMGEMSALLSAWTKAKDSGQCDLSATDVSVLLASHLGCHPRTVKRRIAYTGDN